MHGETKFQFDTFNEHSDLTDSSTLSPEAALLLSCLLIVSSEVVEVNLIVILNLQAYFATKAPEGNSVETLLACH